MSEHRCSHPDPTHESFAYARDEDLPKAGDLWKCFICRTWWVMFKPLGGDSPTWERVTPDHLKAWIKTRKDKWAYPRFVYLHSMERWCKPTLEKGHRNIEYVDALVGLKQIESQINKKVDRARESDRCAFYLSPRI